MTSGKKLSTHSDSLHDTYTKIRKTAWDTGAHTKKKTHALRNAAAVDGFKFFTDLLKPALDVLEQHLPRDVEDFVASYADAVLRIDTATTGSDQDLHKRAQSTNPGPRGVGHSATGIPAVLPISGPGNFKNSSIAAAADRYADGTHGGQCRAWVTQVVKESTGVDVSAYQNPQHDYFASLAAHGTQITAVSALQPGDIVQIGQFESDPNLHTFIIDGTPYQKNGQWYVHVADSNHYAANGVQDERVYHYDREIQLTGDERAYRLGQP